MKVAFRVGRRFAGRPGSRRGLRGRGGRPEFTRLQLWGRGGASTRPHGGPTLNHRGARIECPRSGHVRTLLMEGHPLHRVTLGVPGTLAPLIDIWLDEERLPEHLWVVPEAK